MALQSVRQGDFRKAQENVNTRTFIFFLFFLFVNISPSQIHVYVFLNNNVVLYFCEILEIMIAYIGSLIHVYK